MTKTKTYAVILAAGDGTRMHLSTPKQNIEIAGISVLRRCVLAFSRLDAVTGIIVVCKDGFEDYTKKELFDIDKLKNVIAGGKTRAESAFAGFSQVANDADYVLIHDAARCLVTEAAIIRCIEKVKKYGACALAKTCTDTVKTAACDGTFSGTLDRAVLRLLETPQAFRTDWYREAVLAARKSGFCPSDDTQLLENIGKKVYCVDNTDVNLKITVEEDIALATAILKAREEK